MKIRKEVVDILKKVCILLSVSSYITNEMLKTNKVNQKPHLYL